MKLSEIGLRPCKLGKTTISVYNPDTGKLAGLVKGVERCGPDMPLRKRSELRSRYHWPLDIERDCILVDGEAYFIVSDRVMFFYEDMQQNHPEAYVGMYEEEHKRHLERIEAATVCGVIALRLNI